MLFGFDAVVALHKVPNGTFALVVAAKPVHCSSYAGT